MNGVEPPATEAEQFADKTYSGPIKLTAKVCALISAGMPEDEIIRRVIAMEREQVKSGMLPIDGLGVSERIARRAIADWHEAQGQ